MALDYLAVRTVHEAAVALSFAGFVARGAGALCGAAWVRSRAARTLPHLLDTLLLASALTMVAMLDFAPLHAGWLQAKLGGLVAYIVLGTVAMKPARPLRVRSTAFGLALAVLLWMVSVAFTKDPLGLLRLRAG